MSTPHYAASEMIPGTVHRVERFVGAGGMGTVYSTLELTCRRQFAVKTLNAELAHRKDLRALFVAEGRLLGSLHGHPNIVEVFSQGVTADELELPFIVMELLNGSSARQVLVKQGRLDGPHAVEIMVKVLSALGHAHAKGVVHRDVKPDNIFMHRDVQGTPTVKLIDFGIHNGPSTIKRRIVGTPLYAAPEQMSAAPRDGDRFGPQADIYAAGITLYELLTGHTPFEAEPTERDLLEAHRTKTPLAPSHFVAMPTALEKAILRALAKDPRDRFNDAQFFADSIRIAAEAWGSFHDIDPDVTAVQLPTHVATPIDHAASPTSVSMRTDHGVRDSSRYATLDVSTEPGVPLEVVRQMIEKVSAADADRTMPGTPLARGELNKTSAAPSAPIPAAGVPAAGAPILPLSNSLSNSLSQSMPIADTRADASNGPLKTVPLPPPAPAPLSAVLTRSPAMDRVPALRNGSGTEVYALPPVHADPAAPDAFRAAFAPPVIDVAKLPWSPLPGEVAPAAIVTPPAKTPTPAPPPMAQTPTEAPALRPDGEARSWLGDYREMRAQADAVIDGRMARSAMQLSDRQRTMARWLGRYFAVRGWYRRYRSPLFIGALAMLLTFFASVAWNLFGPGAQK